MDVPSHMCKYVNVTYVKFSRYSSVKVCEKRQNIRLSINR